MSVVNKLMLGCCLLWSGVSVAVLPNPSVVPVQGQVLPLNANPPALLPSTAGRTMTVDTSGETVDAVINAFVVTPSATGAQELLTAVTGAGQVKSGDVVEYRGYFTNKSPDRIRSMTVLMQIPQGVELIGGIDPIAPFATVDGTRFARTPLRTHTAQGVAEVPLFYYKALRWDVEDVGINGTAVVKYRAKIK